MTIEIKPAEVYKVKIEGIRPLLHSRYPLDESTIGKKKRRATVFDAKAAADKCLYKTTDGKIYQPAEHLEGALIKGATQIKWQGKKTFKDIVAQSIYIMPREIPFPKNCNFVVDLTTGVIPSTRGRVPVARPRWDKWMFEFQIRNEAPEDIDINTMEEIIKEAGKIGIGTFRLKYGKFELKSIEKVN